MKNKDNTVVLSPGFERRLVAEYGCTPKGVRDINDSLLEGLGIKTNRVTIRSSTGEEYTLMRRKKSETSTIASEPTPDSDTERDKMAIAVGQALDTLYEWGSDHGYQYGEKQEREVTVKELVTIIKEHLAKPFEDRQDYCPVLWRCEVFLLGQVDEVAYILTDGLEVLPNVRGQISHFSIFALTKVEAVHQHVDALDAAVREGGYALDQRTL